MTQNNEITKLNIEINGACFDILPNDGDMAHDIVYIHCDPNINRYVIINGGLAETMCDTPDDEKTFADLEKLVRRMHKIECNIFVIARATALLNKIHEFCE